MALSYNEWNIYCYYIPIIPLNMSLNGVIIHYGEKGNVTGLILQNRTNYNTLGKFYCKNDFMPI